MSTIPASNRALLKKTLEFYGVESIDELATKGDSKYWSERLWDSWQFTIRDWGMCAQAFDMTKPSNGTYPLAEYWDGERRFYFNKDGEVEHESEYNKVSGFEHKKILFPKKDCLLEDGLGAGGMGPMFANIRMIGFPPTGHGSANIKQIHWGAPIFGEQYVQPDEKIRIAVYPFFTTPTEPGKKGVLFRVMFFRDDIRAKPFTSGTHWTADGKDAVVRDATIDDAVKILFPEGSTEAKGFALTAHISSGLRPSIEDGTSFTRETLTEGGDEAKFYTLQDGAVLNIIQAPEQNRPYAAKWRVLYRIEKRLVALLVTYDAQTLKQELEVHEYAF